MGITMSGIGGTGFDYETLISNLTTAETQAQITPLNTQKTNYQDKLTAWQSLGSKLSTLQTAVENLKDSDDFSVYKASLTSSSTTSADSLLSVSAGTSATPGSYKIQINQLAQSQKIISSTAATQDTASGWTGKITLAGHDISLTDGGGASKSLQTLRDEINTLNTGSSPSGVVASILQVKGGDFRLTLTNQATGSAGMSITDAGHYFSNDDENEGTFVLNTLQAGKDAKFTVDGIPITRSNNTVTDVISGLTLNLKGEEGDVPTTTLALDVGQDTDAVKSKIQGFISAYNQILDYVDQQNSYDATKNKTGGALFGDNTLRSIKSNLQETLLDSGLFAAGITVDKNNRLTLNSDTLSTALAKDSTGTVSLFKNTAQKLDTSLKALTDSIDGTVTLKENSIQSGIDATTKKITTTQDLIDRKMAALTQQYIALNAALSEMQSQQSYLTTQLDSLSSSSSG
jgi:flagellar hook-associated protein 2